jgi:hypothetical protein
VPKLGIRNTLGSPPTGSRRKLCDDRFTADTAAKTETKPLICAAVLPHRYPQASILTPNCRYAACFLALQV